MAERIDVLIIVIIILEYGRGRGREKKVFPPQYSCTRRDSRVVFASPFFSRLKNVASLAPGRTNAVPNY